MRPICIVMLMFTALAMYSQDSKNKAEIYYELPPYSKVFTAGTIAGRMVDALGFRYYWSSEGLTVEDLEYKLNTDSRSVSATLDHVLELSYVIVNATLHTPNIKIDHSEMTYLDKRKQTLLNLKTAADILRGSNDISEFKIIFGEKEIPFWNQINGPIADSIWHCGQIAVFRRASGNPINPSIDHFNGTVKGKI